MPDLRKISYQKAQAWRDTSLPEDLAQELKSLWDQEEEIIERFYTDIDFGTGGLRAKMGVGSCRMNVLTLSHITRGLARYLLKKNPSPQVVISYDSRFQSSDFARTTAAVLEDEGVRAHLFEALRPTPMLSWALRYHKAQAGVMITASHNPKDYNGYKVYNERGALMSGEEAKNLLEELGKGDLLQGVSPEVLAKADTCARVEKSADQRYLQCLDECLSKHGIPRRAKDSSPIRVVYTALHGTGGTLVPKWLRTRNIEVHEVAEQATPDGEFPTVISPNPEEEEALSYGIQQAIALKADLVLASDPDADRMGVALREGKGYRILNGNQIAVILLYFLLSKKEEQQNISPQNFIVKTIVTTPLMEVIAREFGILCHNTLTGFKYIASLIEAHGAENFLMGAEESHGYLIGGEVSRDKDGVQACALMAEACAWAQGQNKTLWSLLLEIYQRFGLHKDRLIVLSMDGKAGRDKRQRIMQVFRNQPLGDLLGSRVEEKIDYLKPTANIPQADVLQFRTQDHLLVSLRPSGTEPKIKFYLNSQKTLSSQEDPGQEHLKSLEEDLEKRMDKVEKNLRAFIEKL
ncbi:MAG: phospho-sugar mutase [Cytophagales bacterium]|nr:phospho-sugar mutase [Cytophagales bacterium]